MNKITIEKIINIKFQSLLKNFGIFNKLFENKKCLSTNNSKIINIELIIAK